MQPTFRHSIIVVLPQPLSPTMMVRGFRNLIAFGSNGENARIPWIDILRISAMAGLFFAALFLRLPFPPSPHTAHTCNAVQRFATNRTEDRVALPSLLSQSLFRGGTHPTDHGIIEGSHLVIKRVDCKAVGVNGRDELDRANQIHQHVPVATPHICRHSLTPSPVPSDCGTC